MRNRTDDMHEQGMDYEMLGGLLGTAWRDSHPGSVSTTAMITADGIVMFLRLTGNLAFEGALRNTMQGRCCRCGTDHEVGRDAHGILCCEICVGQ